MHVRFVENSFVHKAYICYSGDEIAFNVYDQKKKSLLEVSV